MSDSFRPSAEAAQKALGSKAKITKRVYPAGMAGIKISFEEIAKRIREGRNDPRIRGWAGRALIAAGNPSGQSAQAQALLEALRKQTIYAPDPAGTEMIVAAKNSLCLDEHGLCIPALDCDDLCVALGSALLSLSIPIQVVGQAFNGEQQPTHVLLEVDTPSGWQKLDPSNVSSPTGQSFQATREWRIDPMNTKDFALAGGPGSGDFVGVGDISGAITAEVESVITNQLQMAVFTLEKAVNDLGTAINEVQQTRELLRPPNADQFDPDPFPITSIADFPANGIWTESMQNIVLQIWSVGNTLVQAGHAALDGTRKVFVDPNSQEAYIAADPSDPWSLHSIVETAADAVYAFFNPAGAIVGGFLSKNGQSLTPAQVQTESAQLHAAAPPAQTGVQGTPQVGVGNVAIVIGVVAGVAITGVAAYYVAAKLCDLGKTYCKEATNQAFIDLVASGKATPEQATAMAAATSANRVAEIDAQTKNDAADPFTNAISNLGSVVMWVGLGVAVVAGVYVAAPLLRGLAEDAAAARHHKKALPA